MEDSDHGAAASRAQLEKVLQSRAFAHAGRLNRLLRFLVEETIEGRGDQLKEYVIGVGAFEKGESFDPRIDPVVRVETHRLRARLKRYYETEGCGDPVRIQLPKGSYSAVFTPHRSSRVRAGRKALAVAAALAVLAAGAYWVTGRRAGPSPIAAQAGKQTTDVEAYNLYLTGRYHWNKRTEEGLKRSIEYFERAIARDPKWAPSYAALADSWALLASYGALAPGDATRKANEAATKALRIDDALAQAHATLGFVRAFRDWDWRGAEQEYKRAIELNPGYATARQWYAGCLRAMGRSEEALAEMKRAQELDPVSLAGGRDLGRILLSMRRHDQAIEQYRKVLELDPNFSSAYMHLGLAYADKRMYKEAIDAFEKARSLPSANPLVLGALGHAYAVVGRRSEAERLLGELDSLSRHRYVSPISRVFIYIGLGNADRAFEWLERACEDRDPWVGWLKADPVFDSLRPDPRFLGLLRRVHLAAL